MRRLVAFREDPNMTVILMTIGTGAVGLVQPCKVQAFATLYNAKSFSKLSDTSGWLTRLRRLNLTTANRIHIVEPQWNPTIEDQAIGRALRIGQTRNVEVIRYIMEGTVEEVGLVAQMQCACLLRSSCLTRPKSLFDLYNLINSLYALAKKTCH